MTAARAMACSWTASVLVVAALAAPAARVFDGLPWTSFPELALLLAALGVLGTAAAQERIRGLWSTRSVPLPLRLGTIVLPVVTAGLGLAANSHAPPAGFAGCYGTLVPGVPAPPCERSFDAPFAPASLTRHDRTLDFSGNWRLGFVNSRRFNFYRAGEPDRQRLPFRAAWAGTVEIARGEHLEIRYLGEGLVQVGQVSATLPLDYGGQVVTLAAPAGVQRFAASYRHDDGSRVGGRAAGGEPEFRVHVVREDGTRYPLTVWRGGTVAAVLAAAFDVALLLSTAVLVAGLAADVSLLLAAALGVVWLASATGVGLDAWPSFLVLSLTALAVVIWPAARRPGVFLPVAIAVAAGCASQRAGSLTAMHVRSGGQDWLTYESFARVILETWSLQGGEAVFYYQPLYRYAKFLLRLLFGEGDALVLTALNAGLFGGVLALAAVLAHRLPRSTRLLAAVTAAGMLALVCSNWAQSVTYRGLSEPLAWALFPIALTLLFGGDGVLRQAAGMAAAGACAVTRLNHVPAIVLTAGTFLTHRRWRRSALPLALVLAAVLLLPLAHNLVYGGAFVLTTASAAVVNNIAISPVRLLASPLAPDTLEALAGQVRLMFNTGAGWWSSDLLLIGLRVSQLLWLVAIAVALWRRTVYQALVALLPVSYLAAHLVYELHVYYPRHIIAAHLAMAVSASLAMLPRPDRSASG